MRRFVQCIIIVSVIYSGILPAQFSTSWDVSYQHTTATGYSNESRKIIRDVSGNIYVLADATSDTDPNGIISGTAWHYTILTKYTSGGLFVDSRVINVDSHLVSGFENRGAFGLEMDASGFLYLGYINFTHSFNVILAKYNTNLSRLWVRTYAPLSDDYGVDMKVTPTGEVYAAVRSIRGLDTRYHLIMADTALADSSAHHSYTANIDFITSITLDSDQDIYATGYRIVSGFKTILAARVGNNGVLKWKVNYNGGSTLRDDYGTQLMIGPDNNVYVTGTSDRAGLVGYDACVLSFSSKNGSQRWIQFLDYDLTDAGHQLRTAGPNYLVLGSVSSNSIILDGIDLKTGTPVGRQVYEPLPSTPYTTLTGATLSAMELTSNANVYLTGNIHGTDPAGQSFSASYLVKYLPIPSKANPGFKKDMEIPVDGRFINNLSSTAIAIDESNAEVYLLRDNFYNYSNHSYESFVLTKFTVPTPVKITDTEPFSASAYQDAVVVSPNPVSDVLYIRAGSAIAHIIITDMTGRHVLAHHDSESSQDADMPVGFLEKGVYTVHIVHANGMTTARHIIKH